MEHKTFETWLAERDPELHEVATTTGDVALFKRMTIPAVRRNDKEMPSVVMDDETNKKVQGQ